MVKLEGLPTPHRAVDQQGLFGLFGARRLSFFFVRAKKQAPEGRKKVIYIIYMREHNHSKMTYYMYTLLLA